MAETGVCECQIKLVCSEIRGKFLVSLVLDCKPLGAGNITKDGRMDSWKEGGRKDGRMDGKRKEEGRIVK